MKENQKMSAYWNNGSRFADLLNAALFQGRNVIDERYLKQTDSMYHDVLMRYGDLYFGLKNATESDPYCALRILWYDCQLMQEHARLIQAHTNLDAYKESRPSLFPVKMLAVYYGKEGWDALRSLEEFYPESFMAEQLTTFPLSLLEIGYRKNSLFSHPDNRKLAQVCYEYFHDEDWRKTFDVCSDDVKAMMEEILKRKAGKEKKQTCPDLYR